MGMIKVKDLVVELCCVWEVFDCGGSEEWEELVVVDFL